MKKFTVFAFAACLVFTTKAPALACGQNPICYIDVDCTNYDPEHVGNYFLCLDYSDGSGICWGGEVIDNCDGTRSKTVTQILVHCVQGSCAASAPGAFWPTGMTYNYP